MKVKCKSCGLVCGAIMGKGICPECGGDKWYSLPKEEMKEKIDETVEELNKLVREWLEEKGYMTFREKGVTPSSEFVESPKSYLEWLKQKGYDYRIKRKEEGLAFEIIDIKNGNKVRVRKIYLNGHIEGFEGNPLVTNHIAPKIMALKAILKQMNKDYRDFIEKNLLADLPIESVTLTKLYQAQLERVNNIKI